MGGVTPARSVRLRQRARMLAHEFMDVLPQAAVAGSWLELKDSAAAATSTYSHSAQVKICVGLPLIGPQNAKVRAISEVEAHFTR